jgi:A/G-specific adenine glycosylase
VSDAAQLLEWFDRHARTLPWRQSKDPYRIWLSEVMLQQTRVETVLPYYDRFLERFPSVEALADAELDQVLALWSGLGYYRRARQLHAAAQAIRDRGSFPVTVEELSKLPGIGAYTAAAVGSIAFGVVAPVMDGNVERVLSRRLASAESPKATRARTRLLAAAADLLDPARAGDSNQALMEVGATVCLPRRPRCLICPLLRGCRAAAEGDPERYPVAARQRESERIEIVVAVIRERGRVLLFRRPDDSTLLAGTWELPWADRGGDPAAALAARYGGRWDLGEVLGKVRHGITYRDLDVEVRRADADFDGEVAEGIEAGWFGDDERSRLPLSSLVEKALRKA